MQNKGIIYTDGGSRGNPGPGASAYILTDEKKVLIEAKGIFLGKTTNNIAEYTAIYRGLCAARDNGIELLKLYSDSELIVKQINGIYKVKSPNLKELYSQCMEVLAGFSAWKIYHVYREQNKEADALANKSMDLKKDVVKRGVAPAETSKTESTPPIRIGVMLSGGGTTMLNIQKQIEDGALNAEIAVVISSLSTVRGVDLAKGLGFDTHIIRKKDFDDIDRFSDRLAEVLDAAKVDLVVQAGWLCLWNIPEKYEGCVMNIHPALLPSFGGKGMWGHHVHEAVIAKGCKLSGCTVHFCNNEYDSGPIIIQRCCEVKHDDDADTLAARVFEQECIAYPEAIMLFAAKKLKISDGKVIVQ